MASLYRWWKIKVNFTNKGVGAVYQFFGYIEDFPLFVFATEEEYYEMMLMSTYGENDHVAKTN